MGGGAGGGGGFFPCGGGRRFGGNLGALAIFALLRVWVIRLDELYHVHVLHLNEQRMASGRRAVFNGPVSHTRKLAVVEPLRLRDAEVSAVWRARPFCRPSVQTALADEMQHHMRVLEFRERRVPLRWMRSLPCHPKPARQSVDEIVVYDGRGRCPHGTCHGHLKCNGIRPRASNCSCDPDDCFHHDGEHQRLTTRSNALGFTCDVKA